MIFKIIKNHFGIKNIEHILLVILVITSIDNFFIEANRSSWIISHTNSPTYFAKTFALLSVNLLLEKKIFYSILSLSFTLLMHIKVGWVLVPIFFLYIIFEKKFRKKIFYIILPLGCALFLASKEELTGIYEVKKNLFEIALDRDQIEGAFKFQPLFKNISLFISFILFYILNKNETYLKKFNFVILLISVCLFIFNIIYVEYLSKIIPDPRVIILGIPRALELYETFFWMLVLKKILILKTFDNVKIFFITGLFFLLFLTIKSLIVSFGIFIFCTFLYLINNSQKMKKMIKIKIFNVYFVCFFTIFLSQNYLLIKRFNNEIDVNAFSKTGKWTLQYIVKDKAFRLDSALEIKKCNDFLLEDIDVSSKFTNYVAHKSRLFGNVHYNYIDTKFLNEHFKRDRLKNKLFNNLYNKQNLDTQLIEDLEYYDVVLISTSATAELINYEKKIYLKNGDTLTVFNDKKYIELKKCLQVT